MAKRSKDWNQITSEGLDNVALRVDDLGATVYIGKAEEGTPTSSPLWQIRRAVTSGTETGFTWADGDDNFDNVWDDRATITYS